MKTQKFLLAFTLFFTLGIGFVSAWNGLVASPGDILNASKWNELVDKINPLYSVGGTGGSVGVGDSTPDHKLDVAGNIGLNASSYINFGDTTGSTGYGFRDNAGTIQFKNNAGSWISIPTVGGGGNDDLGNHTAIQNIALDTFWLSGDGDDEGIIIDIDGNVGVGEPTPTGKLHITNTYTDTSNATIVASSSIPGINLRTTSSGRFSIFSNYNTANTTSILTSTGTSNPLNVITLFDHVNNRVSIGGDTTPDHTLDVNGNIGLTASSYINFGDTTGTTGYGIRDNAGAIEFKNNAGSWTAIPTGTGIGTLNTLTASSQTFATGSTGADFNFSSAGSVHTLNIPSASATARGLVTTGAQSFAGTKTFTNDFLVNGATTLGDAGADTLTINASTASIPNGLNFDTNTLFLDAANNRIGVGLGTTTAAVHIKAGTATASTAPLKFTSGINLTTPEAGAVEYNGTQLFFSPSATRNILAQISGGTAHTTGSIPFATTNGYLLQDNANLFWDDTANELGIGDNTPDHTLDVNGNIGLTASSYINFGDTTGTSGYGIRDNAGAIEFKNNAGAWTALPTSSGIGTLNTLTASSQTFATGSTGADFNFSSAGSVHTLNIPSAGTTARGLVTTAAQSFAGTKTFTNDFLVNGLTTLGDAGADSLTINASTASIPNGLNFDTNTLFLDATNNRIGVGLGTTTAAVHIKAGTATASTAPLKFTSGINLTTPEAGSVEYDGTQLYFSPSTTRNILAQISGGTALTTGSIPFATTSGYLTQDNANFFWDDTSNELGILTNAPNTKLDINGDISLRLGTDYATSGSTNDVALGGGSSSTARYTGAANGTITGITGGQNGKILNIMNASNFLFTLSNESTSSTTTNRIITGNGQDVTLSPGQATILQYDSTATRWRMLDGSPKRYVYRVTSAQTNVGTTTNYTTITGMTTGTLPIGAYKFELVTKFRSNNRTSGMGLALSNGTAVTSNFNARFEAQIATNGAAAFYHATVGAAGTTIASTAVLSTAIDYYSELRGTFQVTTAGTMNAQFRSEVNPRTTTIQPGSYMIIEPLY